MVDIKKESFNSTGSINDEDGSSVFDFSSVTEQSSAYERRTRRLSSQRCPHCNAWNEINAKKCYNSYCDHVFSGKRKAQSQDVSSSDSKNECSVSKHNTVKMRHRKACPNCGTFNSNRSLVCKNRQCNISFRKKRGRISKASNESEAHKESTVKVSQSTHPKRLKTCVCENPIDASCECSKCGTTPGKKRKTKGESIVKLKSQRKSMRNIKKDQLKIRMTAEWNDEEKELLLSAIERDGVLDLEKLSSSVVTKSKENIWSFIVQNSKTARANLLKSASVSSLHKAPIDDWLHIMENAQPPNYSELRALPIARGTLYLAKYEQQPKPEECGGIDFKSMYETLYAFLCGLPTKKLNGRTARYFMESISSVIEASYYNRFNERIEFLKKIKSRSYTPAQICKKYSGKKTSTEPQVTDIMDLQGMNPLRVYSNLCHVTEMPKISMQKY